MPISNPGSNSQIFNSLPEKVQSAITAVAVAQAIATYAESAELSPDVIITFAISYAGAEGNRSLFRIGVHSLARGPQPY